MQVTIFGANGRVGSLVVKEALSKHYKVVAFVYGESGFEPHRNLKIYKGNIYNSQDVMSAIKGSDAVISALGSWGTKNKDILSSGMKNIIPSMQKHGVGRIVSLTGADASLSEEKSSLFTGLNKLLLKTFANKILQDGEEHIRLLQRSDLDWTVLRSPVMNERGEVPSYSISFNKPLPWATINRSSVAIAMVDLLNSKSYIKAAPYIKRAKI